MILAIFKHSPFVVSKSIRALTVQCAVLLLAAQLFSGCKHLVANEIKPAVTPSEQFSLTRTATPPQKKWWESFQDPLLNEMIENAFGANFTLKQAQARIVQAKFSAGIAASELYPAVDGELAVGSTWFSDGIQQKRYTADVSISWELDLWKKLSSAEKALYHEAKSATEDYQAAAFLLSALICENYLHLAEQDLQLKLLKIQLEASSTFLQLIELRFANGDASVVDIYQQRQQLASIRTQLPIVRKQALLLKNRLALLTGKVPGSGQLKTADNLPEIPPGPDTGIPADLLLNRPDLKSIHEQLLAKDHRIAEAVADRLPGIRLTGSTGYAGSSFSSDNFFVSVLGEIFTPLIDWQKRKREVSKRQSQLEELLAKYSHSFLIAIEETENGIWQEKYQAELINSLSDQLQIAEATLTETRNRYMQGLTDYLPVLTALQSLQRLEREMLAQKREMLVIRIHLYRALGGADILAIPEKDT